MELKPLPFYLNRFSKLKVAMVNGAKAPHKPILLLSVIQLIEEGLISNNKIYITPDLVATFKDIWHQLVKNPTFTANFSLPFYHLKNERYPFWFIKTITGTDFILTSSHSIKSFAHLKQVVDYAYVDEQLFAYLMKEDSRVQLKQILLSTYFNVFSYNVPYQLSLVAELQVEMLKEPAPVYKTKAQAFDEEEIFVRSGAFKKLVPQIYNYSCCISGMRIIASPEIQMVDACHIVPFSESHDDTIKNGISLCPNLHRAFDRGLIGIDNEYRVIVSGRFSEGGGMDYSIRKYEGMRINLPKDDHYLPSFENIEWHRRNCFKN